MKTKTLTAERVQKLADDIRDAGKRANEDPDSFYPYMTGTLYYQLKRLVVELGGVEAYSVIEAALEDTKVQRRVRVETAA